MFPRFCRQLSGLSAHDEARAKAVGQDGSHDKSAAFYAHHLRDASTAVAFGHFVGDFAQALGILEQCADIFELNAGDGEVWNIPQVAEQ